MGLGIHLCVPEGRPPVPRNDPRVRAELALLAARSARCSASGSPAIWLHMRICLRVGLLPVATGSPPLSLFLI